MFFEDDNDGPRFADRHDAGRRLGEKLTELGYANDPNVLVLALPRGGVPVAYEVARRLDAPLDIFLVRKLGVPEHEELAMGAIASGAVIVLNDSVVRAARIRPEEINEVAQTEWEELKRREREYRDGRPPPAIQGKTVILIDDGLATGASMAAAVRALRQQMPGKIVVAVPVAAPETCEEFRHEVDDAVCLLTPPRFRAVGMWYEDFSQTSDQEVRALLAQAQQMHPAGHEV
jgi:predicted phosphoribosyltransferase